jgi:hypothetical protein
MIFKTEPLIPSSPEISMRKDWATNVGGPGRFR